MSISLCLTKEIAFAKRYGKPLNGSFYMWKKIVIDTVKNGKYTEYEGYIGSRYSVNQFLGSINLRKLIALSFFAGIVISMIVPVDAIASTLQGGYNAAEIVTESNKIKDFIFGVPMRVAGIMGAGYGLLQAILSSSIQPLLVYGGIGLTVNIAPKFVDMAFSVSSMLIP